MLTLEVYKYIKSLLRDRPQVFGEDSVYPSMGTKTFTDGTRSIHVVTDEAACRAVLTRPHFRQHHFADLVRTALPGDGSSSCIASEFLERNPINLNGEEHRLLRHEFLLAFNALGKSMLPDIHSLAQRSLKNLVNRGGEASITDVVSVYVDSVVCYLLGRLNPTISDAALWVGSSACIFEFFPSSARLKKKEDQVRKFLAARGASPASESLDTAITLSFLLQGRDPLIGGLCAFLADLAGSSAVDRDEKLKDADGRSLFLAAAPVNYIGRIATRDTRIVELDIAKGDEVVVMLALASGSSDRGGLAFGAGAHVCAGQALSIEIAECWLEELRRIKQLINWAELRPLKSSPAVFQQFEEITRNDASENH